MTNSIELPTSIGPWVSDDITWQGKDPDDKIFVHPLYVGYDFVETFNMEIVQGRSFSKKFTTDSVASYILNEEAVKILGINSPVGKQLSFDGEAGASVSKIVTLLSQELIILVTLANVIVWPVAYFVMNKWLQNFAYRINIGLPVFIFSTLLALVIALITVSFQAGKAAIENPVESLKYE